MVMLLFLFTDMDPLFMVRLLLSIAVVLAESQRIFRVTAEYNDVIISVFICLVHIWADFFMLMLLFLSTNIGPFFMVMLLLSIAVVVAESHSIFRVTADYNDVIIAVFICLFTYMGLIFIAIIYGPLFHANVIVFVDRYGPLFHGNVIVFVTDMGHFFMVMLLFLLTDMGHFFMVMLLFLLTDMGHFFIVIILFLLTDMGHFFIVILLFLLTDMGHFFIVILLFLLTDMGHFFIVILLFLLTNMGPLFHGDVTTQDSCGCS